jgi:hypothetical protein
VIELTEPTLTGAGDLALLTRGDTIAAFDDPTVRYDETLESPDEPAIPPLARPRLGLSGGGGATGENLG